MSVAPKAPRWGVVATVKAPVRDILRFAAHHIDAGADLVHIYLDAPNPEAFGALSDHPKCRVTVCDDAYWTATTGQRPAMVEPRQSANASHAYRRQTGLDWIAHLDVDEFLVSARPVAATLAAQPDAIDVLRVRPMEALAVAEDTLPQAFKDYVPNGPARIPTIAQLYPTYGAYVHGGFLSHVAGKVFVRTGLDQVKIRIHNAFQKGEVFQREAESSNLRLAHLHATSWEDWQRSYPFRLEQGSYRPGLKPAPHAEIGAVTLNDLLSVLTEDDGVAGLLPFFEEVCADTPDLRARLRAHDLLVEMDLALDSKLTRHFPKVKGLSTSV